MKTKLLRKIREKYLFKFMEDERLPKISKYRKHVVYMDKKTGRANYCYERNLQYFGHYTAFLTFIDDIGYGYLIRKNLNNKHKRYEISLGKKLFKCK